MSIRIDLRIRQTRHPQADRIADWVIHSRSEYLDSGERVLQQIDDAVAIRSAKSPLPSVLLALVPNSTSRQVYERRIMDGDGRSQRRGEIVGCRIRQCYNHCLSPSTTPSANGVTAIIDGVESVQVTKFVMEL